MKTEPRKLQAALILFTRLPLASPRLEEQHFLHAHYYLPVIGLIIGLMVAAAYSICCLYFSTVTAIAVAILAGTLLTGALHEDGLADCCDGFGGGQTPEAILAIMKDSRLGTYGVIGLIAVFSLKLAVLADVIEERQPLALVLMHVLGRTAPLLVMATLARISTPTTKMTAGLEENPHRLALIVLITAACLFTAIPFQLACFLTVAVIVAALGCRAGFQKRLAGYNGDCLGACEQITELCILIIIAIYY